MGAADETNRPSDPILAAALVGVDQDAWDSLVDRYAATVWATARYHGLSSAEAAEVSRVIWLRLADHLHRMQRPDRIQAWLVITAQRESMRATRLVGRQVSAGDDLDSLPELAASPVAAERPARPLNGLVSQSPTLTPVGSIDST
jgi:DNA-directed RNA polymerase specialized sigma24 family protein